LGDITTWVIENKEWLFSGAGLAAIVWIGRFFCKKRYATSTQTIRSGGKSINVQAGRDINIGSQKTKNNEE
jgi:hypothetical protein